LQQFATAVAVANSNKHF